MCVGGGVCVWGGWCECGLCAVGSVCMNVQSIYSTCDECASTVNS